jgi:hypothetical protein
MDGSLRLVLVSCRQTVIPEDTTLLYIMDGSLRLVLVSCRQTVIPDRHNIAVHYGRQSKAGVSVL